jgi:hypothetical protein
VEYPAGSVGRWLTRAAVVHCLELQSTAKLDNLSAHRPNRFVIVFAEVGDRLEVGLETPDHFRSCVANQLGG